MYKKFQGDSLRLLGIEPQYWRKLDHILLHAFAKQTAKKKTQENSTTVWTATKVGVNILNASCYKKRL